jgi:hypothetical protein
MSHVERRLFSLLVLGTLAVGVVMLGYDVATPDVGHAATMAGRPSSYGQPYDPQTTGDSAQPASEDQRLPVQLWTVMAAGGAAAVGLLLFFVRIALGRVAPPPPQEDAHH